MAIARHTSERRGQKLNAHCVSVLQGKLLTLNKEEDGYVQGHPFLFFSFMFPHFAFLPQM
jgi:hypothetical protein